MGTSCFFTVSSGSSESRCYELSAAPLSKRSRRTADEWAWWARGGMDEPTSLKTPELTAAVNEDAVTAHQTRLPSAAVKQVTHEHYFSTHATRTCSTSWPLRHVPLKRAFQSSGATQRPSAVPRAPSREARRRPIKHIETYRETNRKQ